MRHRCETCEYFKYVESNVYGRCQNNTEDSILEGIPRVPWATACEFFQDRRMPDKNDLNEGYKMDMDITQKQFTMYLLIVPPPRNRTESNHKNTVIAY